MTAVVPSRASGTVAAIAVAGGGICPGVVRAKPAVATTRGEDVSLAAVANSAISTPVGGGPSTGAVSGGVDSLPSPLSARTVATTAGSVAGSPSGEKGASNNNNIGTSSKKQRQKKKKRRKHKKSEHGGGSGGNGDGKAADDFHTLSSPATIAAAPEQRPSSESNSLGGAKSSTSRHVVSEQTGKGSARGDGDGEWSRDGKGSESLDNQRERHARSPGDVPAVAAVETTTEGSNADAIASVAAVGSRNDGCADSRNKGEKSDSPPHFEKGATQDGETNNIPPLGRDQCHHSADNYQEVVVAGVRERDDEGTGRKQEGDEDEEGEESDVDGEEGEEEDEDPDSAYVDAMEKIWAEAEAWVDAEAQAEEEAWARLPTDVTCCPSESEGGGGSDIDESTTAAAATKSTADTAGAARSSLDHRRKPPSRDEDDDDDYDGGAAAEKTGVVSLPFAPGAENGSDVPLRRQSSGGICGRRTAMGANAGVRQGAAGGSDDDVDELLDLEIEIPVPGGAEEEQVGAAVGGIERFAGDGEEEGELRQRVNTLTSEDADVENASLHSWYQASDRPDLDSEDDDEEEEEEDQEEETVEGGQSGSGYPLLAGSVPSLTRTPSDSGASCFGVERGGGGSSSHEACEEGWAPFSHRELQKKLSSPQRKPQRKILSAAEAKLRQESRRQMVAELNRAQLASGITEKLKQHEERARGVRFRKEEQLLKAEEDAKRKMEGADARRKEHRRGIVRKANDANSKVEEVLFMNKLTVEDLKITLQMKLAEVDRRIQSGSRARRQQLLAGISDRQRKRTRDKAAQMSERRLEAESAAAMRWEALQKRLEAVQQRRRDRERETSRRMQAANRHTQARERRKAMLHHPARVTAPATVTGKAKGGETAVRIDSRRKGTMDAAAAAPAVAGKNNSTNSRNNSSGNARNINYENDTHDEVDFPEGKPRPKLSRTPRNVAVPAPAAAMYEDPPPTQAASAALLLATTACPRRGRAQKKRARKVKDNLRQLCVEASTTGPTATAVAPWPRLEKAARELAELALAKAQVVKNQAAAQAATLPADAPASRLAPAAVVPLAASTEQPSLSMPTNPVGLLSGVNSGDVRTAVVAAAGTTTDENVGSPGKGRAAALIAEVNAEDGARSGDGGGGGGSCSSSGADQLSARGEGGRLLLGGHRKTRRGTDSQSPVCSAVASGGVEDGAAGCGGKPGEGTGEEDAKGELNAAAASEQEPAAAVTAANPGVAKACSTGLPSSSCSSSPSTPSTAGAGSGAYRALAASTPTASMAFPSPAGSTPTAPGGNGGCGGQDQGDRAKKETAPSDEGAAASAAAGEGNDGGREAMTEYALEVMLASLADEPDNRDHVLRIDGGAPLVDCLFRLLERATRHGDTTKRPGPRPPPFDAAVPPEDRTVMGGMSPNSTAETNTKAMEKESGDVGSRSKEYRRRLELPVSSKALCGREVGVKLEVEEALSTALTVVSLLVRHRSSDRSIWRIQEGLVRYLAAKRLLSDLSVLTYQLHAFCAAAALPTTGTRTRVGPAETGKHTGKSHHDTDKRRSTSPTEGGLLPPPSSSMAATDKYSAPGSRSQSPDSSRRLTARPLPFLVLRRKTTIAGSKPTRSLSPLPSGRPLLQVAGRVAELVTAVVSHPLVRPAGPATANPTCRAVEDLRRGALAAPPPAYSSPLARGPATGGAGSPTPASGAVKAVGSLVSLLAAMVGTEKERRQRQPSSSGVVALGAEKKGDDDDSRQRPEDGASPIEASSPDATGSLETEDEGVAIPLSDGLLCLSSAVVQAANLACVVDLEAVQTSLSADGLQPEFLFLCDHLLADLTNRIGAQDVAPPNSEPTAPEGCLEGVLTLLGYFCLDNREHQEVLRRGGPLPSILARLCDLPFRYFSGPRHRAVLLPTLMSICHANVGNRIAAEEELSSEFLAEFLEENLETHRADEAAAAVAAAVGVHEARGATPPRESKGQHNGSNKEAAAAATTTKGSQATVAPPCDWRTLSLRFPLELWDDAISFFRSAPCSDQETPT
ncbi:unnamed protein product [Ectocarpus sp. 6 AP-2014]